MKYATTAMTQIASNIPSVRPFSDTTTCIELVNGRDGLIGRSPMGKIIIVQGASKPGLAIVHIYDDRERVMLACVERIVYVPMPGSGWASGAVVDLQGADSPEELVGRIETEAAAHRFREEMQAAKVAMEKAERLAKEEARLDKADELAGPDGVAFAKSLSTMDWYYSYSDDNRVWRSGEQRMQELRAERARMGACGDEIWAMYCPF